MAAGAAVGAVVVGAAGKGAASVVDPETEDAHWRSAYPTTPCFSREREFDDYQPAYSSGYPRAQNYGGTFDQSEHRLRNDWDAAKGASRLTWDDAKHAIRDAWNRVTR